MAAMIPPRERGRYNGYLGSTYAVATVAGPLVGGLIVDTPWLGWRWCFFFAVPLGLIAFVFIQRTLDLPVVKRQVKVDYFGAVLISAGVSLLLVWASLAGESFGWASNQTALFLGGGVATLAVAVLVECRVAEPIVPLRLFRSRTMVLAVVASACVGVMMFAVPVFLGQYFQLSRGMTPTTSGLLTVPLVLGLAVASTVVGQLISRTGRWKRFILLGATLVTTAAVLLSTVRVDTHLAWIVLFITVCGLGLGMTQQNLVLAVQNSVRTDELGVASSTVIFFRSLGGAAGVAALGAVMAHRVADLTSSGLADAGLPPESLGDGRRIPDLASLPAAVADVATNAYGNGIGSVFLAAVPLCVIALGAVLFLPEARLRTSNLPEGEPAATVPPTVAGLGATTIGAGTIGTGTIGTAGLGRNGIGPAHTIPTDSPPRATESDDRVANTPAAP
jgi:MFS family permease